MEYLSEILELGKEFQTFWNLVGRLELGKEFHKFWDLVRRLIAVLGKSR